MLEDKAVNDIDAAWAGEEALLSPEVRRDADALDALLAPEFREIGTSGRLWLRHEVIAALVSPDSDGENGEWVISERAAIELGDHVIHLSYRLEHRGRVSRRSSLWRVEGGRARILFHQGTAVG
jgi:hypothetical protein